MAADGDRFIEMVSTGALYRGGQAQWERKYWSCSRGKNRYPYPVGYHAVRRYSGISYTMEIQQGSRGPVFQVTSTQGDSATGQTPDIAWKNFHKKLGSKARNWQRTRSYPQKIDGVELFGFKNTSVQRLLRELIVASSRFGIKKPCPNNSVAASPLTHTVAVDVSDDYEVQFVSLDKTVGTAKRSINPIHEESVAKRIHSQDILSSVDNCNDELDKSRQSSDKGGPGSNTQLRDVSGSRCMPPLLEEPCDSKCTRVDDTMGEYVPSSSQEDGLFSSSYSSSEKADLESAENKVAKSMMTSLLPQTIPLLKKTGVDDTLREYVPSSSQEDGLFSSSYLSSEKADLESAENEVAKSMMTSLLPQTIPLLKKTGIKKKIKKKGKDIYRALIRTASAQNPSADGCQGVSLPASIRERNMNSSQTHINGRLLHETIKDSGTNNDCMNDEQVIKSDMEAFVADSFEDDAQIWGDNTSKARGAHHHESDDARSREPNENSIKDSGTNNDCMNDEQVIKSDMEAFVADSFEDDAQIWGDNSSKVMGAHHHESDDACSREPNENSKLLRSERETNAEFSECQVQAHDSSHDDTPDMIYDHDKGQYILSDAYVAFLEEEFGLNDSSHPAHCNHVDNDAEPKQPKDPKEGITNGSLLSMDGSDHKNMCNKHNVFHNQVDQTHCNINHVNGLPSKHPKTSIRGSDHHLELTGCYLHPMPVLSIMLNTKSNNSLHIYVLCGFLASCQRFLYVYNITPKDYQDEPPYFVGYTSLLLPSLEQASTGNFTFGRSGMQFTPDGQFLILLSSIRLPCCRMQNIDCSCSLCKFDQQDDNSLKIVSVNCGYSSLLTKLRPYGTVSSFLICEPNYVVAAEDSRKLHIWKMVAGWSVVSEEYVISSLGNVGSSILELKSMPKSSSLIIGHDGAGGFCLWDISKRALLSTFAAPGNIVFQILPLGICSVQDDIFHASVDDIERRLQEITVTGVSRKDDPESTLMLSGKDIAVWIMVSSASVAEYQHDLRAKEHNARWRLALLANKKVIIGNILDPRATSVDVSGNYGFAGTYGGLLYMWELSSGRKLAGTECLNGQRVSCVAVDAKSRVVAVADDDCHVYLYTENRV